MKGSFRGIGVKLKNSFACKELPEQLHGLIPSDFRLDRWNPKTEKDKVESKSLIERNLSWIRTENDQVIYGLERWGALVPNNYTEWFAIIVIRPSVLPPTAALAMASRAMGPV